MNNIQKPKGPFADSTLYISDLDGTLLNSQGKLSAYTVAAVRSFIRQGGLFTIATARSLASAGEMIDALGLSLPVVFMNGVFVYDPVQKTYLHSEHIAPQAALAVRQVYADAGRFPYCYFYEQGGIGVEYRRLYHESDQDFYRERADKYRRFDQVEQYSAPESSVFISALDTLEVLGPVYKRLRHIEGINCELYKDSYYENMWFCECFSCRASKGVGAKFVRDRIGASRVVAFGDNVNDISLLQFADVGVAVANACKELKNHSDLVIDSNELDAVARFLIK